MQRADKNYKDLKQKQKSVIADKTYSMYSDFSLLQVTLPEVHQKQQDVRLCPCGITGLYPMDVVLCQN